MNRNKRNIGCTRGEFMKMAFCSGVFAAGATRPFRAAAELLSSDRPELTLGIVSDVHIKMTRSGCKVAFEGEAMLRRAFEHFRDAGVDAVAICGDMADCGLIEELNAVGRCWFSVFPENKAPDGRRVEKLFVYGNHDWEGYKYGDTAEKLFGDAGFDHAIRKDLAAAWREAFHEEYEPIWRKEVKGYTFIGAHWIADCCLGWEETGVPQTAPWFAANGSSLDVSKPFFYLQHPPLKNTCHGDWVWGHDTGAVTEALSKFPNAVALSGHSHASIGDERAIWQGSFTSIGCGSLSYTGLSYGDVAPFGRENDNAARGQRGENPYKIMHTPQTGDGHQGMIARVYRDRMRFSRIDFESMAPLGDDWIVPLPVAKPVPFDFASRAAVSTAPEFPAGAALEVCMVRGKNRGGDGVPVEEQDVLEIKVPPANRVGCARALDFSIVVKGSNGMRDERFVFAEGFHRDAKSRRANEPTVCRLAVSRLKATGALTVEVRPRNCFGRAGKPIAAEFRPIAAG